MLVLNTLRYQPPVRLLYHFHNETVRGFIWFPAVEYFYSGKLLITFNAMLETACNTSPPLQSFLIAMPQLRSDWTLSIRLEIGLSNWNFLPFQPRTCGASRGAYLFPSNVVLGALGLINIFGIHTKACCPRLYKPTCFSRGLLTLIFDRQRCSVL